MSSRPALLSLLPSAWRNAGERRTASREVCTLPRPTSPPSANQGDCGVPRAYFKYRPPTYAGRCQHSMRTVARARGATRASEPGPEPKPDPFNFKNASFAKGAPEDPRRAASYASRWNRQRASGASGSFATSKCGGYALGGGRFAPRRRPFLWPLPAASASEAAAAARYANAASDAERGCSKRSAKRKSESGSCVRAEYAGCGGSFLSSEVVRGFQGRSSAGTTSAENTSAASAASGRRLSASASSRSFVSLPPRSASASLKRVAASRTARAGGIVTSSANVVTSWPPSRAPAAYRAATRGDDAGRGASSSSAAAVDAAAVAVGAGAASGSDGLGAGTVASGSSWSTPRQHGQVSAEASAASAAAARGTPPRRTRGRRGIAACTGRTRPAPRARAAASRGQPPKGTSRRPREATSRAARRRRLPARERGRDPP